MGTACVSGLALVIGFFFTAPAAAQSLGFAISAPLDPQFDRFAVDAQGNIVIASAPYGCSLPVFNAFSTCGPIWVGKLDPTGQNLLFGTYLGGASDTSYSTWMAGVGVDAAGNIVLAAYTLDRKLPTVNAFQAQPPSAYFNTYVARLSPDGARLVYATYLGGSGAQQAQSLAVDSAGAAYLTVSTTSPDFPTTPQSIHQPFTPFGAAIAKLGPDGALQYGVTFGFEFYTDWKPIALDPSGSAILASNTEVVRVAPDGSNLTRAPLPAWAPAVMPWVLPSASGGFWLAGTGDGYEQSSAGALQPYLDSNAYYRIEDNLARQPQLPAPVLQLAVDPANRNRIYAATGMGLYRSDDNGWDWTQVKSGPTSSIVVDPFDSTRLYLAGSGIGAFYRSTDSGATWNAIGGSVFQYVTISSLDADPNIPGLIYAAGGVVYRSRDGGDTWDAHTAGPTFPQNDGSGQLYSSTSVVKVDAAHPGWAYSLGVYRCTGFCPVIQFLYRTQDGGNTWMPAAGSPISIGVGSLAVDPNTGDVALTFTATNGSGGLNIYPGGDFTSPRVALSVPVSAVTFDPQHAGSLYAAAQQTAGYIVMGSPDDGATWTNIVPLDRGANVLAIGAGAVVHAAVPAGGAEGLVAMLDGSGNTAYLTYLGTAATTINAAAAGNGLFYVAGSAMGGIPAVNAFQAQPSGGADGFLTAFNPDGSLAWSTYLGGSGTDAIYCALPLSDGSVVVVGTTLSADFPALQPSPLGTGPTFIARVAQASWPAHAP